MRGRGGSSVAWTAAGASSDSTMKTRVRRRIWLSSTGPDHASFAARLDIDNLGVPEIEREGAAGAVVDDGIGVVNGVALVGTECVDHFFIAHRQGVAELPFYQHLGAGAVGRGQRA